MTQLAVDHNSSLEKANNSIITGEGLNMREIENNDMQEIYVTFCFFYLNQIRNNNEIGKQLGLLNRRTQPNINQNLSHSKWRNIAAHPEKKNEKEKTTSFNSH